MGHTSCAGAFGGGGGVSERVLTRGFLLGFFGFLDGSTMGSSRFCKDVRGVWESVVVLAFAVWGLFGVAGL